ncbi:MAG: hypothetical protein MSG64_14250 [Pyrinomonadaceae bacterium MAG19_C2-C3]|nr:hypothetical protein [Pyrinomonadaceae bacterium MAG19_C2-C3]
MSENRDDEWRQRQMDFILAQQAKFTTDIDRLRASDEELRSVLAGYMIESNERMTRAETFAAQTAASAAQTAASAAQTATLAEQTAQLLYASLEGQESLRREVRNLTTVTDRISEAVAFLLDRDAARGNGTNGTGGGSL